MTFRDTCLGGPNGGVEFDYEVMSERIAPDRLTTVNLGGYMGNVVEIAVVNRDSLFLDFTDAVGRIWNGAGRRRGQGDILFGYTVQFPQSTRVDSCRASVLLE